MKTPNIIRRGGTAAWIMAAAWLAAAPSPAAGEWDLPVEDAVLTRAPHVPPPITRRHPARVVVHLEVTEYVGELADGVQYTFWAFGESVPGPFIRIRQGDRVEFNLHNRPDSTVPHNIDLHAVTGPGGGAEATLAAPGQSASFTFTALNPGLYVYHCATPPVGMHIANGMYGLILVEPEHGFPEVDREYYVMQSEFYTEGTHGEQGHQFFSLDKAYDEQPDYVVFNGAVGALTGDRALQAKVGDRVRLFVGNGGPNLVSSFHVIGEIFDKVWIEGGDRINHNVQTTLVPAGGSAIVEFNVEVPGTYILVDHSIFRAFNKGAVGMLKVDGAGDARVFATSHEKIEYKPQPQPAPASETARSAGSVPLTGHDMMGKGEQVYRMNCLPCHQANGQGIPKIFPSLAGSDWLMENADRAIAGVIHGQQGRTTGQLMPPQNLNNDQIAQVMTYVMNSWGNDGDEVTPEQVQNVRRSGRRVTDF